MTQKILLSTALALALCAGAASGQPQPHSALRQGVTGGMTQYMAGGLKSFGSYRDRKPPFNLYQATKDMVDSSYYLPKDKAGAVLRHVTEDPNGKVAGAEDFFYREKIDFGQEPTAREPRVDIPERLRRGEAADRQ